MVFPIRFKEEILLEQGEVKLLTDALFYQIPPETGHPVISYFFQNFLLFFFFHIISIQGLVLSMMCPGFSKFSLKLL